MWLYKGGKCGCCVLVLEYNLPYVQSNFTCNPGLTIITQYPIKVSKQIKYGLNEDGTKLHTHDGQLHRVLHGLAPDLGVLRLAADLPLVVKLVRNDGENAVGNLRAILNVSLKKGRYFRTYLDYILPSVYPLLCLTNLISDSGKYFFRHWDSNTGSSDDKCL